MYQSRKQHRKGRRTSRKLANLEAISQHIDEMCSGCFGTLTEADSEAGECTQCGTPIPEDALLSQLEASREHLNQIKKRRVA